MSQHQEKSSFTRNPLVYHTFLIAPRCPAGNVQSIYCMGLYCFCLLKLVSQVCCLQERLLSYLPFIFGRATLCCALKEKSPKYSGRSVFDTARLRYSTSRFAIFHLQRLLVKCVISVLSYELISLISDETDFPLIQAQDLRSRTDALAFALHVKVALVRVGSCR